MLNYVHTTEAIRVKHALKYIYICTGTGNASLAQHVKMGQVAWRVVDSQFIINISHSYSGTVQNE